MPIRITGLNSGLDTDSIVQELVSAYSTKKDKYVKSQTKLEWKQDAWKEMNTKIYGFYSKKLSNMRMMGNFTNKKITTVSDSTKATVTADNTVVNGTQKLKVNRLATAGYLTGKELKKSGGEIKSDTKLSELGVKGGGTLQMKVGEETKNVSINSNMTVSEFTSALKEQGVNASFDAKQQRFFISSSESGAGNDFEFVADSQDSLNILSGLGLATEKNILDVSKKQIDAAAKTYAGNKLNDEIISAALKAAYKDGKLGTINNFDESTIDEMSSSGKISMLNNLSEADRKTYLDGGREEVVKANIPDANIPAAGSVEYDAYIEARLKEVENSYYKAKYDEDMAAAEKNAKENGASKIVAEDAEIELNGAIFTSNTNNFSINGLNITATGVNTSEMTITTATDVDGIYGMIKDFFGEYNTLMNSMEAAYKADSAKGYEPLTDEEKSEMSDEEVEKWEKKIKDSLLRRDDTLSSVMSTISMAMSKSYEINGKQYSLSSFGINTSGYFVKAENESYAYHIDGDKDDASSEGNTDKLRAAIEADPNAVGEFFTQLAKDVYSSLHTKMEKTTLSSSYTVYNDVQMQKEYDEYTDTIEKWQKKLEELEDYYYKKFSAMETALSKLQSQTNSLTQLLGG